jgi:DNA-binding transcriptional LysR family regulator
MARNQPGELSFPSLPHRLYGPLRITPRFVVECDSASSLVTEVETGCGIAIASPVLKHATGKRLLYRPLTGTTEVMSVGIARATKGDVTPAGEKFCEILRKASNGSVLAKPRAARSS